MSESGQHFQFHNTIQRLLEHAYALMQMMDEDIPEAIPVVGTKGGSVEAYKHTVFDFPELYSFSSELPDSLASYELAKKMSGILKSVSTIIEDLLPNKVKNGETTVNLPNDFKVAMETLRNGLEELKAITKRIFQGMSESPTTVVDLSELRKLRDTMTVMGYEFVRTDCSQIPMELQSKAVNVTNQKYLRQMNSIVQPELSVFGKDDASFGKPKGKSMSVPTKADLSPRAWAKMHQTDLEN